MFFKHSSKEEINMARYLFIKFSGEEDNVHKRISLSGPNAKIELLIGSAFMEKHKIL